MCCFPLLFLFFLYIWFGPAVHFETTLRFFGRRRVLCALSVAMLINHLVHFSIKIITRDSKRTRYLAYNVKHTLNINRNPTVPFLYQTTQTLRHITNGLCGMGNAPAMHSLDSVKQFLFIFMNHFFFLVVFYTLSKFLRIFLLLVRMGHI